ncbi:hypothetical protein [Chryseobacterium sp.]|uniref:hypothetical protein n=1 Tax=Chryseobacterium sp. TaxID=1871047 RepID=UPI0011C725A3|nr:hypothetical protein [Chryseobacterium sp.]TXF78922.1 hypothetical protein FUA25_00570 [Chryseobacterium sp.]
MEFDNLKEMWDKEKISETPEISMIQQKEIHLPLERLRKKMRNEFWSTVVFFVFIILFFIFKDFHFFKFKVYCITLVASMMMVTGFYFFKFFQLYRNMGDINLSTKESLRDLMFQFKLNEQYYVSFYIAFVPFVVCEMLLIFDYVPSLKMIEGLNFILIFVGSCLLMLTVLYLFGKWWFSYFYGKNMRKIQKIFNDLK